MLTENLLNLKLFDECLAPNTLGDGTGCDNMTAIIVRLDRLLPTNENNSENSSASFPVKRPLADESSNEVQPEVEGKLFVSIGI